MHISFFGATREVTGSMFMLTTAHDKILIDCGMFQGKRKESEEKNKTIPFDPEILSNVVLTHAHIDHSGRIPLLVKENFNGRIICTRATADVCKYLLLDSAHIQESDSHYLNYKSLRSFLYEMNKSKKTKTISNREIKSIKKLLKKNAFELNTEEIENLQKKYNLNRVDPLYTTEDAQKSLDYFFGVPYKSKTTIGKDIICKFYDAGHILGSAMAVVKVNENGETKNICFSGDMGRFEKPILRNPTLQFDEEDRDIDLLLLESTYGDRLHEPGKDLKNRLKQVIINTFERGGSVVIPSFALGRTQELIYVLHELYLEDEVPKFPIYVDSPLAINITKVFGEHPECYDKETHKAFLEQNKNPFQFPYVEYIRTVEESMTIMRRNAPHIVVSSSGMCEAGRILHHLRYRVHNARNTILIVGYMAANTLGRRILELGLENQFTPNKEHPPLVKILNKMYPLKAEVAQLGGFSAHADKDELTRFIKESNLRIKKIALVHGEKDQTLSFADHLKNLSENVTVPYRGESIVI